MALININDVKPGEPITAAGANKLLAAIRQLTPVAGKGIRVSQTSTGTVIESLAKNVKGGEKGDTVVATGSVLGRITRYYADDAFEVELFENGYGRPSTRTVSAVCLNLSNYDTLKEGTFVLVSKVDVALIDAFGTKPVLP